MEGGGGFRGENLEGEGRKGEGWGAGGIPPLIPKLTAPTARGHGAVCSLRWPCGQEQLAVRVVI